ncbi:MAG TPA: hypothetical protein VNA57_02810 [Acidimicrobiales bacterium]|nr:hypothetical protein [Acidimicrobiales bacterium]
MNEPTSWEPVIVLLSAAMALALMVLRWFIWSPASTRPVMSSRLGPASWRFSESWASTLTAVGALLGAILGTGVLPPNGRYLSSREFVLLSLLFGFLVFLAPFIYKATTSPAEAPDPGESVPAEPVFEGWVATFLLATAVTLWAALGELATLGFMAAELAPGGTVSYLFAAVLVLVAALMLRYSWCNIRWVLEVQAKHQQTVRGMAVQNRPPPRPWNML